MQESLLPQKSSKDGVNDKCYLRSHMKECRRNQKELLDVANEKAVSGKERAGKNAHTDCRGRGASGKRGTLTM